MCGHPPPVLADVALECLCEVKHIFPMTSHCFLCPALFTGTWRKTLTKISDVTFSLTTKSVMWPKIEREPLTIGLVCPLLSCSPWQVKRQPGIAAWEEEVHRLSRSDLNEFRDHMRKFWTQNERRFAL